MSLQRFTEGCGFTAENRGRAEARAIEHLASKLSQHGLWPRELVTLRIKKKAGHDWGVLADVICEVSEREAAFIETHLRTLQAMKRGDPVKAAS